MKPAARLACERFYIALYRLARTIARRHDHDGGLGGCSCGCPVIGCPPCGGPRA